MRLRDRIPALALVGVAGLLAAANLWFAAARSTIPLGFEGRVEAKERRPEKIADVDDVYLLRLADRTVQVDRAVFDAVGVGETVAKRAWSRSMTCHGRVIRLEWSRDAAGMIVAMPCALLMCAILVVCWRRSRTDAPPCAPV